MMSTFRTALLIISVLCFPIFTAGQAATGIPPFSSTTSGPDVINLGDLNVHFAISVVNKPGRVIPFSYTLSYDSLVWYPNAGAWQVVQNFGWRGNTEIATGYLTTEIQ